jgi:hypothetical protein
MAELNGLLSRCTIGAIRDGMKSSFIFNTVLNRYPGTISDSVEFSRFWKRWKLLTIGNLRFCSHQDGAVRGAEEGPEGSVKSNFILFGLTHWLVAPLRMGACDAPPNESACRREVRQLIYAGTEIEIQAGFQATPGLTFKATIPLAAARSKLA